MSPEPRKLPKKKVDFYRWFFFRSRGDSPFAKLIIHTILIVTSIIMIFPALRVVTVSLRPGNRVLSTNLDIIPTERIRVPKGYTYEQLMADRDLEQAAVQDNINKDIVGALKRPKTEVQNDFNFLVLSKFGSVTKPDSKETYKDIADFQKTNMASQALKVARTVNEQMSRAVEIPAADVQSAITAWAEKNLPKKTQFKEIQAYRPFSNKSITLTVPASWTDADVKPYLYKPDTIVEMELKSDYDNSPAMYWIPAGLTKEEAAKYMVRSDIIYTKEVTMPGTKKVYNLTMAKTKAFQENKLDKYLFKTPSDLQDLMDKKITDNLAAQNQIEKLTVSRGSNYKFKVPSEMKLGQVIDRLRTRPPVVVLSNPDDPNSAPLEQKLVSGRAIMPGEEPVVIDAISNSLDVRAYSDELIRLAFLERVKKGLSADNVDPEALSVQQLVDDKAIDASVAKQLQAGDFTPELRSKLLVESIEAYVSTVNVNIMLNDFTRSQAEEFVLPAGVTEEQFQEFIGKQIRDNAFRKFDERSYAQIKTGSLNLETEIPFNLDIKEMVRGFMYKAAQADTISYITASFSNYLVALFDKPFFLWLWNSLLITLSTSFLGVALASTSAYAFSRFTFPGRRTGLIFLLTTQMIPGAMLMLPIYILATKLNIIGTWQGLVVAYSVGSIPFSIWILKGYYDTIPKELEEAATIDGATKMQTFFTIMLPLAAPALAIVFLFNFMQAWNDYLLARIMLNKEDTYTWVLGLNKLQGQFLTDWGTFSAAAFLVAVPVVILFLASSKYLVSGLTMGSVKG